MKITPIPYTDPAKYIDKLPSIEKTVWLDSARFHEHVGRYSFIGVDPLAVLKAREGSVEWLGERVDSGDLFGFLKSLISNFCQSPNSELPPFQGGLMGYFSYDLFRQLEKIETKSVDDFGWPLAILGLYDLVLSFDHLKEQAWAVSTGHSIDCSQCDERAQERLDWLLDGVGCSDPSAALGMTNGALGRIGDSLGVTTHMSSRAQTRDPAPMHISSNFTPQNYQEKVQKTIEYILAGDIFEANISQRFRAILPKGIDTFELYKDLRRHNSAPFAAYMKFGDLVIASASPERFLLCQNGKVETRPIKGTRPRSKDVVQDKKYAEELIASEKDHAENNMIVDLMRNDLSKVCSPNSVKVPQLCGLESFETVHHLVSVVLGELMPGKTSLDLLRACFPGGSITGAPKVRAMEIIEELEPTRRGPYCGSIGYIGFDGAMDTSIVIRTFCIKGDDVTFQAGGAVVLDSDPGEEYQETFDKAKALREVLLNG